MLQIWSLVKKKFWKYLFCHTEQSDDNKSIGLSASTKTILDQF